MNDPVFLDSAAFLRVWQRVTGEAGIPAAPAQPEPDAITAKLRECICAKAAGAAFYAALAQRVCAVRQPARSARRAGARTAQSAANRVFSAHRHALRPTRRLSAAEHGGGRSALCLFAGACAQRAAGRGSGCCADAAQRNAAHHGAAGCAPRAARAHAALPADFLNKYTQNANLSNWYLTLREILIIMCKLTI